MFKGFVQEYILKNYLEVNLLDSMRLLKITA